MRDSKRIDKIMRLLKKLWKKYPDMRLGQLLENYVFRDGERGDKTSVKLFRQEDDETLSNIDFMIETTEKYQLNRKPVRE